MPSGVCSIVTKYSPDLWGGVFCSESGSLVLQVLIELSVCVCVCVCASVSVYVCMSEGVHG